jgi:tetratricopeptide (TPR) repeat protein
MPIRIQAFLVATCLILSFQPSAFGQQPPSDGNAPKKDQPLGKALLEKLIKQLGGSKFAEREAASKQIESIGESALDALQKAAKSNLDLETRRRLEQLIEKLEARSLENLIKDGIRHHQKNEFTKAGKFFDQAIKKAFARYVGVQRPNAGDMPFLTELLLHSARNAKEMSDYEKACKAYMGASYYSNYNAEKRRDIERELSETVTYVLLGWKETVKEKIDKDAALKTLVSKYPLVHLHSRRYAGGSYLQSAYSFIHESTDANKHLNDVQLLFDDSHRAQMFGLKMVVGQANRVAELGLVAFEKNPDPATIGKKQWQADECKAVDGHVYLENVKDDRGNDFFVVFKVIAVDKESRYVSFVWRRLPGGSVVKRK